MNCITHKKVLIVFCKLSGWMWLLSIASMQSLSIKVCVNVSTIFAQFIAQWLCNNNTQKCFERNYNYNSRAIKCYSELWEETLSRPKLQRATICRNRRRAKLENIKIKTLKQPQW